MEEKSLSRMQKVGRRAKKFVLSRKKNFKLDEMQSTNAAAAPESFAMKREGCGAFVLSTCVLLRA